METLDSVWVDYLCPKCGFAYRHKANDTVYCKYRHRGRYLTPMKQITSVGDLQVKARKGVK